MDGDTAQEDGLAVEQELLSAHLDMAEAYLVFYLLAVALQLDVVQPRCLGCPEDGSFLIESERSLTAGVGRQLLVELQVAYLHVDAHVGHWQVELHLARYSRQRTLCELDFVIVDMRHRCLYEHHVARQSAEVPPVGLHGRHGIGAPAVVHPDYHRVLAFLYKPRNVEEERREATLMSTGFLPVHPYVGLVVDPAEVEVEQAVALQVVLERALVPHRPFIEEEVLPLRVPVGRHVDILFVGEVKLGMVALRGGLCVLIDAVAHARVVGVHHNLPPSVERCHVAAIHIVQHVGGHQLCGHQHAHCQSKKSFHWFLTNLFILFIF